MREECRNGDGVNRETRQIRERFDCHKKAHTRLRSEASARQREMNKMGHSAFSDFVLSAPFCGLESPVKMDRSGLNLRLSAFICGKKGTTHGFLSLLCCLRYLLLKAGGFFACFAVQKSLGRFDFLALLYFNAKTQRREGVKEEQFLKKEALSDLCVFAPLRLCVKSLRSAKRGACFPPCEKSCVVETPYVG